MRRLANTKQTIKFKQLKYLQKLFQRHLLMAILHPTSNIKCSDFLQKVKMFKQITLQKF